MIFAGSFLKRLAAALSCVCASMALAACDKAPERPVTIGTNLWIGYEPGYIADAHGLYGDADVSLRQFTSATEAIQAFRNQSVDIVALTLDEALMVRQSGIPIKVFLVADISNGADVIMARPGIDSVENLAGKRVAAEDSAVGDYMLSRALQQHGLQGKDVIKIALPVDEMLTSYTSGKADAVVTFEPLKSQLARTGAVKIFDSSKIPNEIVDVLVTREDFAKANPNVIAAVAEGWLAAIDLANGRSDAIVESIARRLAMTRAEVDMALNEVSLPGAAENRTLLTGAANQIELTSRKLMPMLEKRYSTRFTFQPGEILTAEFLPESAAK